MNSATLFFACAAALVVLVVVLLFLPALIRKKQAAEGKAQPDEGVRLLAEERASLDRAKAGGSISEEDYAEQIAELERRVIAEQKNAKEVSLKSSRKAAFATLVVLLVMIPAAVFFLYGKRGTPEMIELQQSTALPTAEQNEKVVKSTDPTGEMARQAELRAKNGISEQTGDDDLIIWCRKHPEDGRANVMLARRLADRKEFMGAMEFYKAALENDKKAVNPVVLTEAAAALVSLDEASSLEIRMRQAAEYLDKALLMKPDYGNAMQVRAMIAVRAQDWKTAEAMLSNLAARFPKDSEEYKTLSGQAAKAADLAKKAAKSTAK